jgi:tRNA (cytidine/uridine-2'-O-)-methyltransferase
MRLVLFEPDIPQNTGAMMRLAACLGVGLDIIEPCGFLLDDRRLRRAGMDYLAQLDWRRWSGWQAYAEAMTAAGPAAGRLVLLTTRGVATHRDWRFRRDDRLMVGRETGGVPDAVHAAASGRIRVPMVAGARSLNVATTAAIVLAEALAQTDGFPR